MSEHNENMVGQILAPLSIIERKIDNLSQAIGHIQHRTCPNCEVIQEAADDRISAMEAEIAELNSAITGLRARLNVERLAEKGDV